MDVSLARVLVLGTLFLFLSESIQTEECKSDCNKRYGKNDDPHKNTGDALLIDVYKEVGVDQRCGRAGSGCENRRIKS